MLKLRTCLVTVYRSHYNSTKYSRKKNKMPKEEKHLKPLQIIRNERRNRQGQEVPASVHFQVIGNGAVGGPKSLFLYSDHNRYLFNCGEGTQRLCTEHAGSKTLAQLSNIFITRRTWANLGGLPGMCLSIRASGAPDVTIHGPDGCMRMYEATKHFVVMHDFALLSHRAEDGVFEDAGVSVQHVPFSPKNMPKVLPTDPKYPPWEQLPVPTKWTNSPPQNYSPPRPSSSHAAPSSLEAIDQSVTAYIVTFKPRVGKLDVKRCIELGVPPGPVMGLLKKGQDITLDNGRVVRSWDVVGQPDKPCTYVILECPTSEYVDSLLEDTRLQSNSSELENIQGIFHFTPHEVVNSPKYAEWINSFPMGTQNIIINEKSSGYGSLDVLRYNAKMNLIAPEVFPKVLQKEPTNLIESLQGGETNLYPRVTADYTQATTSLKLHVRPHVNVKENYCLDLSMDAIQVELDNLPGVRDAIKETHQNASRVLKAAEKQTQFPKVTFLGTGSSAPSKYRNVSSILVETEPDNFILMDCGEGTLLQIHRHFGRKASLDILKNLQTIYVSHLHADHHLGLINLILHRDAAFKADGIEPTKLFILAPSRISNYLVIYHTHFEPVLTNLYLIRNEHLLENDPKGLNLEKRTQILYPDVKKELVDTAKMKTIKTCRAFHCPSAFCVAFVTRRGFKFVYSGDTRPIEDIVFLGKEDQMTDLLIHEATMEHHMVADCMTKRHTTFTQAIEISNQMAAKKTICTHFSQRYTKIPVLDEFEVDAAADVCIAFDNMTVTPQTIDVVKQTYPALRVMFKEELEMMEEKKNNFEFRKVDHVVAYNLAQEGDMSRAQDFRDTSPKRKKSRIQNKLKDF